MKSNAVLALVTSIIDEELEKVQTLEGQAGPRGIRGKDGHDFIFEEHEERIKNLIPVPKDGVDGKDFIFEEHSESIHNYIHKYIEEIKEGFKLKFSDLSEDEIVSLIGPKGLDGKDGKDFVFEENADNFQALVNKYIEEIKEDFKLRFSDLSSEDIEAIRGPRGQRGKKGDSFIFEEHEEKITNVLFEHVQSISDELKLKFGSLSQEEKEELSFKYENFSQEQLEGLRLKFSDLTEENKTELKLKFSDLTDDERQSLKGSRGQRGKIGPQGIQGEDGKDGLSIRGAIGPQGLQGVQGPQGIPGQDGIDGKDGKDAPEILDVELVETKSDFRFKFIKDNGDEIITSPISKPKGNGGATTIVPMSFTSPGGSADSLGLIIPNTQCDPSVYIGALVYQTAEGVAFNAIATSKSTSNILGIVESKEALNICTIRVMGVSSELFTGLDLTQDYYLSDVVAGAFTTSPIASGHIVLKVGQAYSAKRFLVLKGTPITKA